MPAELDMTYLSTLKTESGMTNAEISAASGVPIGSIGRIMSGETRNPSLLNAADIMCALGGSLDALVGAADTRKSASIAVCPGCDKQAYERALESSRASYDHAYQSQVQAFAEARESHKTALNDARDTIKTKDRWLLYLFIYSVAISVVCIVLASMRFV